MTKGKYHPIKFVIPESDFSNERSKLLEKRDIRDPVNTCWIPGSWLRILRVISPYRGSRSASACAACDRGTQRKD